MRSTLAELAATSEERAMRHGAWEEACGRGASTSERARVRARWTRWAQALGKVVREGSRAVRLPARGLAGLEAGAERREKIARAVVRAGIERAPEALRGAAAQALVDDEGAMQRIARVLDPGTCATRGARAATEAITGGSGSGWCEGWTQSLALERVAQAHEGDGVLRRTLGQAAPWLAWRALAGAPHAVLCADHAQWLRWTVNEALGSGVTLAGEGLAGWPWPEMAPPLGAAGAAWRERRTMARREWENAGAAAQRLGARDEAQGAEDAREERARAARAVAQAIEEATERWWRRNAPGAWRAARARFEREWPAARREVGEADIEVHASGRGLAWEVASEGGNEVFAARAGTEHEAARVAASAAGVKRVGFVLRGGSVATVWQEGAGGAGRRWSQAMGDALARALGRAVAG